MSLSQNFATVKPSLMLDFANTKRLDPRITFTRASTAVYYDGVTTAKAEENLLLQSQAIDQTPWLPFSVTITANTTVAPDGTTTADTLAADGTTERHYVAAVSSASVVGKTVSIYAKAGTGSFLQIHFAGDAAPWANFNLTAGSGSVGSSGSNQTASIVDTGNGWYRCVLYTPSTAATDIRFCIVDSGTAARFPIITSSASVVLWGAQLEQRSAVTAYTPTTTQAITNYIPVLKTAASGEARFDHNPTTGESLGLLIEESRTNLLTYSEQFDNAAWIKQTCAVTANTVVAPDGTATGDKLISNSGTNGNLYRSNTLTATSYTQTIYAKAGEWSWLMLGAVTSGNAGVWFNLASGVIGTQNSGYVGSITPIGNGWYRCSVTFTATAASWFSVVFATNADGGLSIGNGYSGIYIWGAQLEAGSFATSYIPTVAAQVTRAADAASMTGTNFSSWYRADEGTMYAGFINTNVILSANDRFVFRVGNSVIPAQRFTSRLHTSNAIFALGTVRSFFNNGSAFEYSVDSQVYSSGTTGQVSIAYKALNDFAASVNGNTVGTDTSGSVGNVSMSEFNIGSDANGSNAFSGTIKKLAYYPKRLTNAQLQNLTLS